ncbi:MAG TPA: hypothetical protein PKK66_07180 [Bacteroidales bacterium]|nr:hypothetical protein [Bacteroidales bacterium]HPT52974.1 hypothetical protein [Bacteroidales bacterium]
MKLIRYRHITQLVVICGILMFFVSCLSSKYAEKAFEYEQVGLTADAFFNYCKAVDKDDDNMDAKLGLKRTGQIILDEKLGSFNAAYSKGEFAQSVLLYEEAATLFTEVQKLGVTLSFPSYYKEYYEESKNGFLSDKYVKACQWLDNGEFVRAEIAFKEILAYDKNYKDAGEKLQIAISEPKYRNAIQVMESGKYRKAYFLFEPIKNYKDVGDLRTECLEKGTAVLVIQNRVKNANADFSNSFISMLTEKLQKMNDPFIRISMSVPENSTAKNYQLVCDLKTLTYNESDLKSERKKGWLRVTKNHFLTGEIYFDYEKIYYYVYSKQSTLDFAMQYSFLRNADKSVAKSNFKSYRSTDAIEYATYSGDKKNLFPGYWKKEHSLFSNDEDFINTNPAEYRKLQELFSARQTLSASDGLLRQAVDKVLDDIYKDTQDLLTDE